MDKSEQILKSATGTPRMLTKEEWEEAFNGNRSKSCEFGCRFTPGGSGYRVLACPTHH